MKKLFKFMLFLGVSAITFAAPKYVFVFIGDGLGASQRQMAEYYAQETHGEDFKLTMNSMPVVGINTTHALDNLVTDSAAAGTALATGKKTNNGMIAMLPDGTELKSSLDYAMEAGKATGVITSTRITHATPAAFVSKNVHRDNENEIAEDYASNKVDFIAGGGYRNFIAPGEAGSKRKEGDMVAKLQSRGYKTFIGEDSAKGFMDHKPAKGEKVFAALTSSHLPYEIDRMNTKEHLPSLADLTAKGIEVLEDKSEEGFFMVIEGGRVDHASHAQDVAATIWDALAFDEAVNVAMDFYNENKDETLILVAGDHETGGLGMGVGYKNPVDPSVIDDVKASVEDTLQKKYKGNRDEFFSYIGDNFGLRDLSAEERSRIVRAMDVEDSNGVDRVAYGSYSPTAIAVAHIVNSRAGVGFTTFDHTGSQIPFSAIGKDAEMFNGFIDNAVIGKKIISIYN